VVKLRHGTAKVYRFPAAKPNVEQTQARDSSAEEIVENEISKRRNVGKKKVIFPILGPRKNDEKKSQFKTEKDKNHYKNSIGH
jgi:hypothetical protein